MSIQIGLYLFDGPFVSTAKLEDRPGVYVVICGKGVELRIIDVGEADEVKTRVENHDREECWKENCQATLAFAAYYTPNLQRADRMAVEKQIRSFSSVPCGER